jgi:cobaltochelatase CobN
VVIGIQPARGYNIDPKGTYHDPELVPPHGYLAFYIWLREIFGADALVHMGKHGNLEWLPGKALALSQYCYPEAALGPVPVIYPFIVNDPGEGAQAKRRTAAVVVDHLMPAMARAESYGPAAELEALIDEYAAAEAADPRRVKLVAGQIFNLAQAHGFDRDLGLDLRADRDAALAKLDEHICDLKELQIRDGPAYAGRRTARQARAETLVALARVPRGNGEADASLLRALADDLGSVSTRWIADFLSRGTATAPPHSLIPSPLAGEGQRGGKATAPTTFRNQHPPGALAATRWSAWKHWLSALSSRLRLPIRSPSLTLGLKEGGDARNLPAPAAPAVLGSLSEEIAPALDASGPREIAAVLDALSGRFVPPGPSGAPTRGRSDCLPTGRNFYSVDVRAVPTPAAWELGRRSADMLAERYFQDEGEWPRAIALTVWGTSNMRTGGDDIAQALALIGAKPVWEAPRPVTAVEVIALFRAAAPRVDVTAHLRFFRDAFPAQIALFHEAVQAVPARRAGRRQSDRRSHPRRCRPLAEGLCERCAEPPRSGSSAPSPALRGRLQRFRRGHLGGAQDLAAAFLEWSAYAYGGGPRGGRPRPPGSAAEGDRRGGAEPGQPRARSARFRRLLPVRGRPGRLGRALKGAAPRIFHNDHSRPERPVIRGLEEEIARVVRGRAANPKWIAGVMRHGYKGAFEIAATVDYLFAFAATTNAVRHHHFDQLYDAYLGDSAVRTSSPRTTRRR